HQGVLRSKRALRPAVRRNGGRERRRTATGSAARGSAAGGSPGRGGIQCQRDAGGGARGEEVTWPPADVCEGRRAPARRRQTPRKLAAPKPPEPGASAGPKVVSIDAFRKK